MTGLLVACDDDEPTRESAEATIIERGYAAGVEVSGAGEVLVSYVQPPEDDEGTYLSAWRLYDESGKPLADGQGARVDGGSAQLTLWPLPEGFLMRRPGSKELERIDPAGGVSPVRPVDRLMPTRAGDVLVAKGRFYRPSDDTSYRMPHLPRGVNSVAIDRAGGVWLVLGGDDPETAYSRDGRAPWLTLDYELPPGAYPGQLQASGEAVLLLLVGDEARLLSQDIGSPGPWHRVELAGVDSRAWTEPEASVVGAGTLLLGEWGPHWYVGDGGVWTRIVLPDPEPHEDFLLASKGERIFARSTQDPGLRWSDDLGRTWHKFAP